MNFSLKLIRFGHNCHNCHAINKPSTYWRFHRYFPWAIEPATTLTNQPVTVEIGVTSVNTLVLVSSPNLTSNSKSRFWGEHRIDLMWEEPWKRCHTVNEAFFFPSARLQPSSQI